jgi:hypothetical protein
VRNPLDVIQSFASFANVINHSIKPKYDFDTDYPEWWDFYVHWSVDTMTYYFDKLIEDCVKNKKNPIYFCRYEDLVVDLVGPSKGVLEFLLDVEDLEGTNAMELLIAHAAKGKGASQVYQTKSTTGVANAHAHRYTAKQLEYIKKKMGHILYFFGYTNHPTEENPMAFFNFDSHSEENLKNYMGFKEVNKASVKRVCGTDGEEKKLQKYYINNPETGYDLLPKDLAPRLHDCAHADARMNLNYPEKE